MANLEQFIERGMAFFNGNMVAKAELEAVNKKLTAAETAAEEARTASTQAKTDLATANTSLTTAQTRVKELEGQVAAKDEEIKTLKAERDDLTGKQTTVSQEAARLGAAAGIPAGQAPAATTPPVAGGSLTEQYAAIKDPKAAAEFRDKHYQALMEEGRKKK